MKWQHSSSHIGKIDEIFTAHKYEQRSVRLRRRTQAMYVIECECGDVKIGFSHNVTSRLNQLQSACHSHSLMLIKIVEGNRDDERRLLEKWNHLQTQGEWFRPDQEMKLWIQYEF